MARATSLGWPWSTAAAIVSQLPPQLLVLSLCWAAGPLNAQQPPALFSPPTIAKPIQPQAASANALAGRSPSASQLWRPRAPRPQSSGQRMARPAPGISIQDPDPLAWRSRNPTTFRRHGGEAAKVKQASGTSEAVDQPQLLNPAMINPWGESSEETAERSPGDSPQTPTLAAPRQFDATRQTPTPASPALAAPQVDALEDPFEDLRFAERDRPQEPPPADLRPEPVPADVPSLEITVQQPAGESEPSPQNLPLAPNQSPLGRLTQCEQAYEGYQEEDRDCLIATCELKSNAIGQISLSLAPDGDQLPYECRLGDDLFMGRHWVPSTFTWTASALCQKPLYFEQRHLERYGHSAGPVAQPLISSAHFFANIAVWPYRMGMHPCSECRYALGYYRPGSCAPWIIDPIPFSRRGAMLQTAAVLGAISIIP